MPALSAAAERALAAAAGDGSGSAVAQSILRLRGSVSGNADTSRIDADGRAVVQALLERVRQDAAVVRGSAGDRLESAWVGGGPPPMIVLRILAVIVAIGGIVDPAIQVTRTEPLPVRSVRGLG